VTPSFAEEPYPGITYGLPTKEALDDPDFRSGGCLVPMPENYFCEVCARKLEYEDMIFSGF
jgi:hypothetical protein